MLLYKHGNNFHHNLIAWVYLLQLAVDTPVTTLRATRGGKQDDYVSF
jgi:hypothetical protein